MPARHHVPSHVECACGDSRPACMRCRHAGCSPSRVHTTASASATAVIGAQYTQSSVSNSPFISPHRYQCDMPSCSLHIHTKHSTHAPAHVTRHSQLPAHTGHWAGFHRALLAAAATSAAAAWAAAAAAGLAQPAQAAASIAMHAADRWHQLAAASCFRAATATAARAPLPLHEPGCG